MSRNAGARGDQPERLDHSAARGQLLGYLYGRLSAADDARIAAHTRACAQCRAEGLHHLATERMHAMQQRAKPRRNSASPLTIALSVLLAALVGLAGLLLYGGVRNGALHALISPATTGAQAGTTLASTSPTPTAAPVALKAADSVGDKDIVALAASPDGKTLAIATNPNGANTGGVVLFQAGKQIARLLGFEGFQAPGTLAWSPDGKFLAASGNLTLFIWNVATGVATTVRLPASPGTDSYIFDWQNQRSAGSVPATIFAATGFAQWGTGGAVTAAPVGAAGASNVPALGSPIIALWSGQSGTRIFRDSTNTTLIGVSDADHSAHAAMLRWSPDDRYLLWGYPRLPVSAILLSAASGPTPGATAVGAPDTAFGALVARLGQATDPNATAIIWPAPDGQTLAIFAALATPATIAIQNAQSAVLVNTLPDVTAPAAIPLNALGWESANPVRLALTTGQAPAGEYAP